MPNKKELAKIYAICDVASKKNYASYKWAEVVSKKM